MQLAKPAITLVSERQCEVILADLCLKYSKKKLFCLCAIV